MFSLKEASEQVGISKQALFQKIKRGGLSASKNSSGHWVVDPAELFRVYDRVQSLVDSEKENNDKALYIEPSSVSAEYKHKYESEKRMLEATIKELEETKHRLKESENERRETQEKLTLLLTNESKQEKNKGGFIKRLFDL